MVSDSDLVNRLHECLKTSDLTTTTTATVRKQLEQDFGIDLTDKKKFIREQVDLYLQNQQQNDDQEQEDVNIDEQDEEVQDDDDEEASNGKKKGYLEFESLIVKFGGFVRNAVVLLFVVVNVWSKKENKEVKKKGGGFTKLCSLSPQLQKFTGVPELARTEVVKQLWSYIREHDLQDPANRRNIRCDGQFRELFDVDTIDMFQMNKALAKHIWPLNSDGAQVTTTPKEKKPKKKEREEDSEEPKRKEKRQKGAGSSGSSGILAPIPLSEALVKFLGTGENALARSDVVKRIWDYIKQNNLQDPSDKRRILCDDKLKELFDVDTFIGFGVSKLLAPHFMKTER
ncbi:upstream activation factor subunit spp27-like protein [Tanacetum coccineum]